VATLIFTSGTTGRPKAVQLPHRAITVSLQSFLRIAPGGADGRVLCYLPLSHIAERFMSHYLSIAYGAEITCVRDPERLYDEITRVRPTRFFGVPRVYAKLADRARAILAASPDIDVGPRLGLDQAHYRGVATAPSSHAMLEFFQSIGLPVGDIWGLSEAIMCTATPAGRMKPGTVGRLLDGVEARLADDGEILVRGPNTFLGYAGDPERTAQIRDADGWVHTGDLGAIDSERYLTIAGRKKDMLITATGRNVAPATVEAVIREASPLIDQVVAVGDSRRFITVLIALDAGELSAFAERRGLGGAYAELARHPTVMAEIEHAVQAGNARLDRAERVRSWHVADSEWRPGGDEITPTMKVRRDEILRKYAADIEQMYVASAES
jgi:long-subunit acyl-CoA synthetase (AMP-forming)